MAKVMKFVEDHQVLLYTTIVGIFAVVAIVLAATVDWWAAGLALASVIIVGAITLALATTIPKEYKNQTLPQVAALRLWSLLIFAMFAVGAIFAWLYQNSWPLVVSVLVTGLVVSLYAFLILAARQVWIMTAIREQLFLHNMAQLGEAVVFDPVPWWTHGFFTYERELEWRLWLAAITNAVTGDQLRQQATRAILAADGIDKLAESSAKLKEQAVSTNPHPITVRYHCRVIAETFLGKSWGRYVRILKVQNMLCILGLILLAIIAAFSALGWAAPMLVGGAAATLFRINGLVPEGTKVDGGPRWMALLLTPLVGAVGAVVGLVTVAALVQLDVLSESLRDLFGFEGLSFDVFPGQRAFDFAALGVAAALGWSAKLLDRLLGQLTDSLVPPPSPGTSASTGAAAADVPPQPPVDPIADKANASAQKAALDNVASQAIGDAIGAVLNLDRINITQPADADPNGVLEEAIQAPELAALRNIGAANLASPTAARDILLNAFQVARTATGKAVGGPAEEGLRSVSATAERAVSAIDSASAFEVVSTMISGSSASAANPPGAGSPTLPAAEPTAPPVDQSVTESPVVREPDPGAA